MIANEFGTPGTDHLPIRDTSIHTQYAAHFAIFRLPQNGQQNILRARQGFRRVGHEGNPDFRETGHRLAVGHQPCIERPNGDPQQTISMPPRQARRHSRGGTGQVVEIAQNKNRRETGTCIVAGEGAVKRIPAARLAAKGKVASRPGAGSDDHLPRRLCVGPAFATEIYLNRWQT